VKTNPNELISFLRATVQTEMQRGICEKVI